MSKPARKLERVRCAVCDKEVAGRTPARSDGSVLFPRRHAPAREGVPTLADGSCSGSDAEGLPVEVSTLQAWASAIEREPDRGGDALRSALRTLRALPPSPRPSRPAADPAIEVLAERCYEAWRGHFGGVDPCNGIEISPWTDIHENERRAWRAVALAAATPTEDPTT